MRKARRIDRGYHGYPARKSRQCRAKFVWCNGHTLWKIYRVDLCFARNDVGSASSTSILRSLLSVPFRLFGALSAVCSWGFVIPSSGRKRTETPNPHEIARTKRTQKRSRFSCFVYERSNEEGDEVTALRSALFIRDLSNEVSRTVGAACGSGRFAVGIPDCIQTRNSPSTARYGRR